MMETQHINFPITGIIFPSNPGDILIQFKNLIA